jgi:heme exporter protein C
MHGKGLRTLALLTALTLTGAYALVFFWTPNEADQGFVQKIFYLHVPMAIVALCGFLGGGIAGLMYLRTRDAKWDLRAYVAIHLSQILAVGVLITGSIWARASWGHWWLWDEPMLVSFLIVFLLYCTYQVLRFSIEDRERQARYASVFAIMAGAFVPLNFVAVRAATPFVHPRVLATANGGMPSQMALVFVCSIVAMTLLFAFMCTYEITSKRTSWQLRALRRRLLGSEAVAPLGRSAAPAHDGTGTGMPSTRPHGTAEVAS